MRYMRVLFAMMAAVWMVLPARADEGMWLPLLLKGDRVNAMRAKGFKLTAEDLYSINRASLKDAIVRFDGGCTGVLVSSAGLLLTNHHCGFDPIQQVSTFEHDYLAKGYAAGSLSEEIPCPGLEVELLAYMEDVSGKVLRGTKSSDSRSTREARIEANIEAIYRKAKQKDSTLIYKIEPLFYGNQYMLYAKKVYRDVRFVLAPPSDLGKFGSDTDNWVWPRHTCDFSMFRVYANQNNEPADYSPTNVPYRPAEVVSISTKGPQPGDFALVYGFPGRTKHFLHSTGVEQVILSDPRKVSLRSDRLETMTRWMRGNPRLTLQYASKYANVSNAWKKWQGEELGLRTQRVVESRQAQEGAFTEWVNAKSSRRNEYGRVLNRLDSLHRIQIGIDSARDYYNEGIRGIESFNACLTALRWFPKSTPTAEEGEKVRSTWQTYGRQFFKDYSASVDRELALRMLGRYMRDLPTKMQCSGLQFKGDSASMVAFVDTIFNASLFTDSTRFYAWLAKPLAEMVALLPKDPLAKRLAPVAAEFEEKVNSRYWAVEDELAETYRLYVAGLQEMAGKTPLYPDANGTLRIAYGSVEGYKARDAVQYEYTTTIEGLFEKADGAPSYDYQIPERLRELHAKKDFGRWAVNGTVPACFVASVHTTGGNSGSPVFNGQGQLLGLNFDRVWEGTMSDIQFDASRCRNITLDVRFLLFMVEKYFNRPELVKEMKLAN